MFDRACIIKKLEEDKAPHSEGGGLERAYCLFALGARVKDTKLMKVALKRVGRYLRDECVMDECEDFENAVIGSSFSDDSSIDFIREIAEETILFDLINGILPVHRTELLKYLNPFVASAEEWYDTYCFNLYDKRKKPPRKSALTQFVEDVSSKIGDLIQGIDGCIDKCFRDTVLEYLNSWLCDFLSIVEKNAEDFGHILKPFGVLLGLVEKDSLLEGAFNIAFDMFLSHLVEYEEVAEEDGGVKSLLDIAAKRDNLSAFRKLISVPAMPLGNIRRYPESNLDILSLIFSHGLLLPGTEEGKKAFINLLKERNPTMEMIKAVDSPLYHKDDTLLIAAIGNSRFSPDKYYLLLSEKGNIETERDCLPPLYYALCSGGEDKVKAVIALGGDFFWHDEDGNNLLHHLMRNRPVGSYSRIFSLFPLELLEERNNSGERTIDYLIGSEDE